MTWRIAAVSIAVTSILLAGWLVLNHPAQFELKAAGSHGDAAAFGSILYQATDTPAAATPTPAPTATPIPPTPTPTPEPTTQAANTKTNLPIIPIFLGILFVGLVLAVGVPVIRSRFARRK